MNSDQFNQFLARHNWTGYEFSKLSGLPKSTIYAWADSGVHRPADKLLIKYIDKYPKYLTVN
jgi:predicted transcriptional regulator